MYQSTGPTPDTLSLREKMQKLVPGRAAAARLVIRNLFTRPEYSTGEVRTLRGIVRGLSRKRHGAEEPGDGESDDA